MYHFVWQFTNSASTKRSQLKLPDLASFKTLEVIYLDYSIFTDKDIQMIQGFNRQVRNKIPHVGDLALKVAPPPPPRVGIAPPHEIDYVKFLNSRTRIVNHAKVVVDYVPSAPSSLQPPTTSASSNRQAPPTVRTAAEIREEVAQGREKRHKPHHGALSGNAASFGSSLHNAAASSPSAPRDEQPHGREASPPAPLRGRRQRSRRADFESSSPEYSSRSSSRHRSPSSHSEEEYIPSQDSGQRPNASPSPSSSRAHTPSDSSRRKEFTAAGNVLKVLSVPEPKFRGDSEAERERLDAWLQRLTDQLVPLFRHGLLRLHDPVHHLAVVSWITGCVSHTAQTWWTELTSVSKGDKKFSSWEEIHAAFKKHFSQPGTKDKAVALLKSLSHRATESMTDYNARFRQAAVEAKQSDEVNKFLYSMSLPEPIRAQLESTIRADIDDSGDPLTPGLFTLETLMAEVLQSEQRLRLARRMSQAASSSSSLNRGAGYHHTSGHSHMNDVMPVPSSFDNSYLREVQQEVMNASVAELNAMAARQSYRPNDRQRSSSYNNSRDNRRGSNNQHLRPAAQQSYGSSESTRPQYQNSPHTSRPPQQSSSAPRKPHPVFTRGVCDLSSVDIASYNPKATEALKKWPWLSPIKFDLLMCRIKQNLCYSCGIAFTLAFRATPPFTFFITG